MRKFPDPRSDAEFNVSGEFENYLVEILVERLSAGAYKLDRDINGLVRDFKLEIIRFNERHKHEIQQSENDSTKKNASQKLDTVEISEYIVKKAWYKNRGKLKQPKLNNFRWNLYAFLRYLYKDKEAVVQARKISLPYLPTRRLVVQASSLDELSLDLAHAILWKARTYTPRAIKDKKSLAIARLFIELLWQGYKVQDMLKNSPISLDVENRLIFSIVSKLGKGYQLSVLSPVSSKYIESPLRVLRAWISTARSERPKSLDNVEGQPTVYRLVGRLLRGSAKELGLNAKVVTHENFRNAGILHRIVSEDLAPVAVAAFTGIEPASNVMKPASVYKHLPVPKGNESHKKDSAYSDIVQSEKIPLMPKKSARDTEVWEMVSGCRRLFKDYDDAVRLRVAEKARAKIKRNLKVQLGRWRAQASVISYGTNQSWDILFDWLITMVHTKLKPRSVSRYMESICNLLDYCYLNEIDALDVTVEDVREIIAGEEDIITKRAVKNIKTPLNRFFKFLKGRGKQIPELKLNILMKIADKNPRMIDLPLKSQIEERVRVLYDGVIPRHRDAALIGLMGGCLGMRQSEIASIQIQDLRILGGDNDYLVVYRGKGGKQRRIYLSKLSPEMRKVFYDACDKASQRFKVGSSNWFLQSIATPSGVVSSFDHYWSDIAPDGIHSLRHAYATNEYIGGRSLLDMAVSMGHSTLRTLVVNYIQSVWYMEWLHSQGLTWDDPAVKTLNLKELEALTFYTHSRVISLTDDLGIRKKVRDRAYRRGHISAWQIDFKTCLETLIKLPHEVSRISPSQRVAELYR